MTLFEKVSGLAQIPTPHMEQLQCSHVAPEEGQQSKSKVPRARPVCQLWAHVHVSLHSHAPGEKRTKGATFPFWQSLQNKSFTITGEVKMSWLCGLGWLL